MSSSQKDACAEIDELASLGEAEPTLVVETDKSQASEHDVAPTVLPVAVPVLVGKPSRPVDGASQTAQSVEGSKPVAELQQEASAEIEALASNVETEPTLAVNADKVQASEQNEPDVAPAVLPVAVPALVEKPSKPVADAGQTAQDISAQESVSVEPENVEKIAVLEDSPVSEESG